MGSRNTDGAGTANIRLNVDVCTPSCELPSGLYLRGGSGRCPSENVTKASAIAPSGDLPLLLTVSTDAARKEEFPLGYQRLIGESYPFIVS